MPQLQKKFEGSARSEKSEQGQNPLLEALIGQVSQNLHDFLARQQEMRGIIQKALVEKDPSAKQLMRERLTEEASNWAMPLGVISNAIRHAQGIEKVKRGGNVLRGISEKFAQAPDQRALREDVVKTPGFDEFSKRLQEQLRKAYGDTIPVFRGMGPEESKQLLESGLTRDILPMSMRPQIADAFAPAGGGVLGGRIPVESVYYRSPFTGPIGHERELVVNPTALLDTIFAPGAAKMGQVGHTTEIQPLLKKLITEQR